MWEDEAQVLGQRSFDFNGDPLLKTHLGLFNRFLCLELEGQDEPELALCRSGYEVLTLETVLSYCRHLYGRLELKNRDVSACIYELHDFVARNWEGVLGLRLVEAKALLEGMNINLNELRRLRLLHKALCAECRCGPLSHVSSPDPLGDITELDGQMKLFSPEYPVVDDQINDSWNIVSKHVKALRLLLRGEDSQKELSLPVSKSIMNHAKRGDRLPLSIAEAWDGQKFILSAGMPPF
jgi:hypothetical protein